MPGRTADRVRGWVKGEHEILPAPRYLPASIVAPVQRITSFVAAPNPGYALCPSTGQLLGAWRYWEFPELPSGVPPSIYITREVGTPVDSAPHLRSEVRITEVAGQRVVQVGDGSKNPAGEPGDLMFHIPVEDGMITVSTTGIALEEVSRVLEGIPSLITAAG